VTTLFVWYRVAHDSPDARRKASTLLDAVHLRTGVRGRLLERQDERGATWMEIYDAIGDPRAFDFALADAVRESGALALADGGRHAERFEPFR